MIYDFKLPDIGEGLHEAEIVQWFVKPNEVIKADQVIAEVQTDKATVEIPSPVGGKILSLAGKEGITLKVGEVLIKIENENNDTPLKKSGHPIEPNLIKNSIESLIQIDHKNVKHNVLAAPTVRKLARELGIDINQVTGTGPRSRIIEKDVRAFISKNESLNELTHRFEKNHLANDLTNSKSDIEKNKLTEEIPLRGLRKLISEKMVKSVYTAPHVTGMDEFDVTELVELRESLNLHTQKNGIHLTYLPFIIKAVTKALKKHPYFNASITDEKIILKKYYHIGIATNTPDGLVVPVIKDADQKSILEIATELNRLVESVLNKTIHVSNLTGSTFTISSTGKKGGWFGTPIINYPEVAILGVHSIKEKPVILNKEIVIRNIMGTSLSFDHRIIDGANANEFMETVKSILEYPQILSLEAR